MRYERGRYAGHLWILGKWFSETTPMTSKDDGGLDEIVYYFHPVPPSSPPPNGYLQLLRLTLHVQKSITGVQPTPCSFFISVKLNFSRWQWQGNILNIRPVPCTRSPPVRQSIRRQQFWS